MKLRFCITKQMRQGALIVTAFTGLTLAGCMTGGNPGTPLHQNSKGTISLRTTDDWSYEAAHPAIVDQMTIAKVLRAIQIDEPQTVSQNVSAVGAKPIRVFSDGDIEFLAPQLVRALSQAKPKQLIEFRVTQQTSSGNELTAGTIYASASAVNVTLTQFQGKSWKSRSPWFEGQNSATKVMTRGTVSVAPEMAARTENASEIVSLGKSNVTTMTIDVQPSAKGSSVLSASAKNVANSPQQTAAAPATPVGIAESVGAVSTGETDAKEIESLNRKLEDLRQAEDTIQRQNSRMNAMKKDLESIKRQLVARQAEINSIKAKKVSLKPVKKKTTAEVTRH